jgi:hypothetical protein
MGPTDQPPHGDFVDPTEDWRGVDIAQIRRQLAMTPAERLRSMTHVANVMMQIRRAARSGR